MKSIDGDATIEVVPFSAALGASLVIAAPPAGRRIRMLAMNARGTGGTFILRDATALVDRMNISGITSARPITYSCDRGIAIFGDGEGVEMDVLVTTNGTITYVVEPMP